MGEKSKYFHAHKPKFLSQLRSHAPKSAKIANIVITPSPRKGGGSFGRFSDLAKQNIRHSSLEQKSWIFEFERNISTSSNKMKLSPRGVKPDVLLLGNSVDMVRWKRKKEQLGPAQYNILELR